MLPWILPYRVARCVMVDYDIFVLGDLKHLWGRFHAFTGSQVIGAVIEMQPTYFELEQNSQRVEALGMVRPGFNWSFNTGVTLWDLAQVRTRGDGYLAGLCQLQAAPSSLLARRRWGAGYFTAAYLAEQSVLNTLARLRPGLFYQLPLTWNVQLCDVLYYLRLPRAVKDAYSQVVSKQGFPPKRPALLHMACFGKTNLSVPLMDVDGEKLRASVLELCNAKKYLGYRLTFARRNKDTYCALLLQAASQMRTSKVAVELTPKAPPNGTTHTKRLRSIANNSGNQTVRAAKLAAARGIMRFAPFGQTQHTLGHLRTLWRPQKGPPYFQRP